MSEIADRLTSALADCYAIERELGQGGMATVYLAEDLKHKRKVAVKVLRPELAAVIGAERFLKEIEVTANLQHPHILPLFDSGDADSFLYYVMPFIEGESLRDRLEREKQLPVDDAVRIASEVADALDYAHRHDVIHRDIKPENVLLHDGRALVADFGIALAVQQAGGNRLTETGLSLGTPHYMSPEQAMADRDVDARSDIYAVGAMLYEMLAGDPPHTGSTAQAVIAKVVTEDARALSSLRRTVPADVEFTVHRAIERLPADRFASASEFVQALRTPMSGVQTMTQAAAASSGRSTGRRLLWPALAAGFAAVAVFGWMRPSGDARRAPTRLTVTLPPDATLAQEVDGYRLTISPDGRLIAYVGDGPLGQQLFVRDLETLEIKPIAGTEGAYNPFFSPDGEWIAFVTNSRVARVQAAGGPVFTIGEWPTGFTGYGGMWLPTDTLVMFQEVGRTLLKMAVTGGTTEIVVPGDSTHWLWWPQLLPDQRHAVLSIWPQTGSVQDIGVLDLETSELTTIAEDGFSPKYTTSGHLLFHRADGSVIGAPFDLETLEFAHPPVPVMGPVAFVGTVNTADLAVSDNGTLVYIPAGGEQRALVIVDREGNEVEALPERRPYQSPKFSPDGSMLVMAIEAGAERDLWTFDLDVGTLSRLTFGSDNLYPVWTPDGELVVFSSRRSSGSDIFITPIGQGSAAEPVLLDDVLAFPSSITPDGSTVLFREIHPETGFDILQIEIGNEGSRTPVLQTPFNEASPMLSPDGNWLAYISDQSGRFEVYLQKFPEGGRQMQISLDGGAEPLWRRDGRELFYRRGSAFHAVELSFDLEPRIVNREQLFEGSFFRNVRWTEYDVHPDGQHFVFVKTEDTDREIVVVLDWFTELERIMAEAAN